MTAKNNVKPFAALRNAPDFPSLPPADCDPFVNDSLVESHLLGVSFDVIESNLGILLGLWRALARPRIGDTVIICI